MPYKYYEDPIMDRLQSSYADVRFEVNKIREKFPRHKYTSSSVETDFLLCD